jgi:hypothetical protein
MPGPIEDIAVVEGRDLAVLVGDCVMLLRIGPDA